MMADQEETGVTSFAIVNGGSEVPTVQKEVPSSKCLIDISNGMENGDQEHVVAPMNGGCNGKDDDILNEETGDEKENNFPPPPPTPANGEEELEVEMVNSDEQAVCDLGDIPVDEPCDIPHTDEVISEELVNVESVQNGQEEHVNMEIGCEQPHQDIPEENLVSFEEERELVQTASTLEPTIQVYDLPAENEQEKIKDVVSSELDEQEKVIADTEELPVEEVHDEPEPEQAPAEVKAEEEKQIIDSDDIYPLESTKEAVQEMQQELSENNTVADETIKDTIEPVPDIVAMSEIVSEELAEENKQIEGVVPQVEDVPPPPPPPLVIDATPPPPPPLDENVKMKRASPKNGTPSPKNELPEDITSFQCETKEAEVVKIFSVAEPEPAVKIEQEELEPVMSVVQNAEPPKEQTHIKPPEHVKEPEPIHLAIQVPSVQEQTREEEAQETPKESETSSEVASSPEAVEETTETKEVEEVGSPKVSPKINKKNFKSKIKFGPDLVDGSIKQLQFLHSINQQESLQVNGPVLKRAIYRYEQLWLPLAAEHKKETLAAPLDVEWIWHCHLLSPVPYELDCNDLVGMLVDHKVMSEKERTKSLEKARKYWTNKYPDEPFDVSLTGEVEEFIEIEVEETEPEVPAPTASENNEAPEEATVKTPLLEAFTEQQSETPKPAEEIAKEPIEKAECKDTEESEKKDDKEKEDKKEGSEAEPEQKKEAESAVTEKPTAEEPVPRPKKKVLVQLPWVDYAQKSSCDIIASIAMQRVFYYQVSLPHYQDKSFLKSAVKRYQKLLYLKHQNPDEFLVPCYDIDLVWHTHQLHPAAYKHDTVKILGRTLNHSDSVNDRKPGSKLQKADIRTRELWKEFFNENFICFGSMFRGDPPILCSRMELITPQETFAFSTKKANVAIDKVQIEGLPDEVTKFQVKVTYVASEKEGPVITNLKGNKKKLEFENTKKGLANFMFDTKEYDRLKFNMSQQIGFACAGHDEELGQDIFNFLPVVESMAKESTEPVNISDTIMIDEEKNLKATFTATVSSPKQGPCVLFLQNGNFERRFCIMPEHIEQMWGPVPLPRLPAGMDNNCIVASHRFTNHTGEVIFTCRMIHSQPILMSAIQVFYHNKMTAVGHLVGSDQLPLPSQVAEPKKCPTLNLKDGQRCVLLKNKRGDWGFLIGHWTGFRKPQPAEPAGKGKKPKKAVAGSQGTLALSFYKCANGTWQHLQLGYLQNDYKFQIQDASVDLRTGAIEVSSDSNEVAENIALAFAVPLLHVLCQPRPTYFPSPPSEIVQTSHELQEKEKKVEEEATTAEGDAAAAPKEAVPLLSPTPPSSPKSSPLYLNPIPSEDLSLVVATGYMVDTPTNFYIQNTLGKKACAGSTAIGFDVGMAMIGETAVTETTAEAEVTEGQGHVTEGQVLEVPATTEAGAEGGYEAETDLAVGETSADIAACGGGCGGC